MSRRNEQNAEGYDVPMLRDFLDHLRWEVTVNHAENTHLQTEVHPELAEALEQCIKKRGCIGLLMANRVKPHPTDNDLNHQAITLLRTILAERAKRWKNGLDSLQDLFDEVMACVAKPDSYVVREWKPEEIIEKFREGQAAGV